MTDASTTATVRVGRPRYGGLNQVESQSEVGSLPSMGTDVPFVIEGERATINLPAAQASRSAQLVELVEVLDPAKDRVAPLCRHFGVCGGCQYQHLPAESQSALKARLLRELLEAAGIKLPQAGVVIHASHPFFYRNRVRLRVEAGRLGYSRRASHTFLPIAECPIVSPLLWRAAQQVMDIVDQGLASWPESSSELELFTTESEDALQLSLHLDATIDSVDRSAPSTFRQLCDQLRRGIPQLRGAGLLVQARLDGKASRRVQERQRVEMARWGEAGLLYRVGGREYPVSRNAFFQVNRFLTERMVDLVVGQRSGALAMDLYAGAGLFTLPLTERFDRVIAVEIGDPAATDLSMLLQSRGASHRAERKTTLAFLRDWAGTTTRAVPDLVVMDPPRAGLGLDVVRELLKLRARELVYVSCDPTTFARDARALVESGYAVAELHSLDLFPQTFHMETIAVFLRR